MAARITGQYSRLGALLDPLADRLLVLSGASWPGSSSCCRAGRSRAGRARALMLVLTRVALRRGIDSVNMLGRWAVWPMMCALASR